MRKPHTLHPQSREAVRLIGGEIARRRRERRVTSAELAERAGISVVTLRNIERGFPNVAIGSVFEVATLLGIALFAPTSEELARLSAHSRQILELLPERVREVRAVVSDDF